MKKSLLTLIVVGISLSSFAQKKQEEKSGFDLNRLFAGGSLAIGYGTAGGSYGNNSYAGSSLVLGVNPEIGYSLTEWLDAGIAFNAIYNSTKYFDGGYNLRQNAFNYGAGVFTRIYPFNGFFVQVQPEYNWIDYKQKNLDNGNTYPKQTIQAGSFLAGAGYGQRLIGDANFFTVIMFDLASEKNSPYRDGYGTAVPIFRGGINFYFGKNKKK